MKNIIITAGPTNERIDSVMKITNMSTGALGAIIADEILNEKENEIGKLYYISPKLAYKPKTESNKLEIVTIESTLDLLHAIKDIIKNTKIHGVIHSAAVGDYYGEYTITGEQLAKEIADKIYNVPMDKESLEKEILTIIEQPSTLTDNSGKISSYENNLMVKLGLTPKVIGYIKTYSPESTLVGFKLLDGVKEEELLQVASNLLQKNNADYIVANDLSQIGGGKHPATIINKNGIYAKCETKKEIAKQLTKAIFY